MFETTDAEPSSFVHAALFYRCEAEYLDTVVPFITDGVAMDYPVLVAVPADKLALLDAALGDAAAAVTMVDMTAHGRNPTGILGGEQGAFAMRHRDRPVRMIGEAIWPGRTADQYPACVQHEALANEAFKGHPGVGLCPYDAAQLDAGVLADARTTHPLLWQAGSAPRSPDYAPGEAWARYNQPLPNEPTAATYTVRTLRGLSAARSFAARYGQWHGLGADGTADLQVIVTELASNSLQHTNGACRLAFFEHDGHVVCAASDSGRFDDPLAGRRVSTADAAPVHGLALVNALSDLVRIHATDTGTTIRAYLRVS
jgi:anti-sigma regulatory factor (Ser/Thr protein kinase)